MMFESVICEAVKVNSKRHWRCQEERADGQIEVSRGHKRSKLKESLCELQGLKLNLWALINPSAVISYHLVPWRYYTETSYLVFALLWFSLVWLNPALLFFHSFLLEMECLLQTIISWWVWTFKKCWCCWDDSECYSLNLKGLTKDCRANTQPSVMVVFLDAMGIYQLEPCHQR